MEIVKYDTGVDSLDQIAITNLSPKITPQIPSPVKSTFKDFMNFVGFCFYIIILFFSITSFHGIFHQLLVIFFLVLSVFFARKIVLLNSNLVVDSEKGRKYGTIFFGIILLISSGLLLISEGNKYNGEYGGLAQLFFYVVYGFFIISSCQVFYAISKKLLK